MEILSPVSLKGDLTTNSKLIFSNNTVQTQDVTFDGSTSTGLKASNTNGYVTITPLNTGWAHIYTDRSNFIFDKPVWSVADTFSSYDADLKLQRAGATKLTIGTENSTMLTSLTLQYGDGATQGIGRIYGGTDNNNYLEIDGGSGDYAKFVINAIETLKLNATDITFLGNKVYHAGNDGSGSGLDADLLDGKQATGFIQTPGSSSSFISSNNGGAVNPDNTTINGLYYCQVSLYGQSDGALYNQAYSSAWQGQIFQDYRTGKLAIRGKNNGVWTSWQNVWSANNDGSGSGLDADLLDGNHASVFAKLNSPALTGTPTAPTQQTGDNTANIATTAFVQDAISDVGGGGSGVTSATVVAPAANWYRIAKLTGPTGRGDGIVSIYTTGGSYGPYTAVIKYHKSWSNVGSMIVEAMTSVGYWSGVRLTQDNVNTNDFYLEVYIKTPLTFTISTMLSLGYPSTPEILSTLQIGGGTVICALTNLVVGINTTDIVKSSFVSGGTTYQCWFTVVSGVLTFNYEEV